MVVGESHHFRSCPHVWQGHLAFKKDLAFEGRWGDENRWNCHTKFATKNCLATFHLKTLVTQKKSWNIWMISTRRSCVTSQVAKQTTKTPFQDILEQKLSSDISNWYLYVLCPPVRLTVSCNPFTKLDSAGVLHPRCCTFFSWVWWCWQSLQGTSRGVFQWPKWLINGGC